MKSTTTERLQQCAQAAGGELVLRYETVGKERHGFDSKGRLRRKVIYDPLNANTTVLTDIDYDSVGCPVERMTIVTNSSGSFCTFEWEVLALFAIVVFAVIGVLSTIHFFATR